jgi:hypothetical protein
MKASFFLVIVLILFFSFCSQKTSSLKKIATKQSSAIKKTKNEDKMPFDYCTATIMQGLYGCCTKRTGNCASFVDTNDCKLFAVKRAIFIYEATTEKQANASGRWCDPTKRKLIAQTESDENGCYQIQLPVGEYSIFVFEDGKYYFLSTGNNFIINGATVDSNKVAKRNVRINNIMF